MQAAAQLRDDGSQAQAGPAAAWWPDSSLSTAALPQTFHNRRKAAPPNCNCNVSNVVIVQSEKKKPTGGGDRVKGRE
jgi:hypothetical protein